jgi:hypothetical protein
MKVLKSGKIYRFLARIKDEGEPRMIDTSEEENFEPYEPKKRKSGT